MKQIHENSLDPVSGSLQAAQKAAEQPILRELSQHNAVPGYFNYQQQTQKTIRGTLAPLTKVEESPILSEGLRETSSSPVCLLEEWPEMLELLEPVWRQTRDSGLATLSSANWWELVGESR